MKKALLVCVLISFFNIHTKAQTTYISVTGGGNWNNANTWDVDFDDTGGDGIPGANDIAVIIGDGMGGGTVNITSNVEVGDLYVVYNNTNVLSKAGSLFATYTLTINGQLGGVLDDLSDFHEPTTTVIENDSRLEIVFTNDNSSTPNIFTWGHTATLKNITVNPSSSSTTVQFEDVALNGTDIVVSNGTLRINAGFSVADATGTSTITVNAGTTLDVRGGVNGGSSTTNFNEVEMVGASIITVYTNGYLNSDALTISAGATLNITNSQPSGWWNSGSPGPTSVPIDLSSTINYNRLGAQSVYPGNYGNLSLNGSGTKTLTNQNTLYVNGTLSILGSGITFSTSSNTSPIDIKGDLHNDGTWSPTQNINFNGTSAQSITGNNMVTFGGGITISNSAGVSLSNQDADVNGTMDIDPGAVFDPNGRQVDLSGNLVNDGTLTASGTFVFDGTTTVSGSGTNAFNDVTVTGTISAPSKTLTVAGDFANNGTFSNVNGTVTYNGINAQNISGSNAINFYNLSITNSGATVSNNATSNLNTAMTLGSGATFDADGSGSGAFTVLSTSGSNSARINAIPSDASITGNVVIQRYFNGGGDVWRNFGTAVSGATVSQITGAGFTINGNDLAYYNETVTGGVDNGWVLQSTFGSSISNSRGYSMWTRAEEMPVTINFTGSLNQQSQSMPITYTNTGSPTDDGWNLVNNPFPSTVDWDLMTRNGSVSGTVAVWNTTTSSYDYWNGSTGNLTNGLIASGQAFWVQTNGSSPTLSIPESSKATSSTSFLRSSEDGEENILIVSLAKADTVDRTYVHFREGATDGFDTQYDGRKLVNGIFNLYSLSSGADELSINSLSASDCQTSIDLGFYQLLYDTDDDIYYQGFIPGQYNISLEGLSSFTKSLQFDLVDHYQGGELVTSMGEGNIYIFTVDTTQVNSWGNSRFELRITEKEINPSVFYDTNSICDEGTYVGFTNTQIGIEYAIQKDGETIVNEVSDGSDLSLFIPSNNIVEGQNQFDVLLKNGDCSSVLLNGEVTFNYNGIIEVNSVEDGKNCGPGRVLLSASGAEGNSYYNWYESIDSEQPITGENGNDYLTPELETTKFYYVSIVNESGCQSSKRVKVIAQIVNLETPVIFSEGDMLSTQTVADSYQWYKNGEALEGETNESLIVEESGTYSLETVSSGCSMFSENIVMEILGFEDLNKLGVSVYPNPVENTLHIDVQKVKAESLKIYDVRGDMIYQSDEVVPNEINLSDVKKGIYIVNIITKNQIINFRVKKK